MKSGSVEHIFLDRSLTLLSQDLLKLRDLIDRSDNEECCNIQARIDVVKTNIVLVEDKIREKFRKLR